MIAKAYNSDFLCVIQPARPTIINSQINPEYSDGYWTFRSKAKGAFDKSGIKYVDLNEHIEKILPEMFMDAVHLNGHGNHVMAEIVASLLREEKLLED